MYNVPLFRVGGMDIEEEKKAWMEWKTIKNLILVQTRVLAAIDIKTRFSTPQCLTTLSDSRCEGGGKCSGRKNFFWSSIEFYEIDSNQCEH